MALMVVLQPRSLGCLELSWCHAPASGLEGFVPTQPTSLAVGGLEGLQLSLHPTPTSPYWVVSEPPILLLSLTLVICTIMHPLQSQREHPRRAKYSTTLAPLASQLIPLSSSRLQTAPPAKGQIQNNRVTCFVLLGVTGDSGSRVRDRCFPALLAPSLTSALTSVQAQEGESKEGEGRGPGKGKGTRKVMDRNGWDGRDGGNG